MKIRLSDKLSSFQIYDSVLKQLSGYYSTEGRNKSPIISLIDVCYINANAMPLLMCILNIIYRYHREEAVKIQCNYQPKLFYFLYHSNFFFYAKDRLKFIEIDDDFIGGFDEYVDHKYRQQHKLHVYQPIKNYYDLSPNEQIEKRGEIYEFLAYHLVPRDYGQVLSDIGKLGDKYVRECIMLISEIIANAQVYSKSLCYSYLQTNKYSTIISVADVGIGLSQSLNRKRMNNIYKGDKFEFYKDKKEIIKYEYRNLFLEDYLDIMEALYYSECQDRINLWYLKNMIVRNQGILRIHTNTTQVIFTSARCKNCTKGSLECMECLLKESKIRSAYSPVKIFDTKLAGVHIEIEIKR